METRGLRVPIALLVAWLCLIAGLTSAVFGSRELDDYVGFVPATAVIQIPAFLALIRAPFDQPFGRGRALALALPAALLIAFAAFWFAAEIGIVVWGRAPFQFNPLFLGACSAIVAFAWSSVLFTRSLTRRLHPVAARRILISVALAACAAAIMLLTDWAAVMREPAIWLIVALPVVWTLPLWLMLRVPPPIPPARAQIA